MTRHRRLERIARRLSTLELRAPDDDDDFIDLKPGTPFGRVQRRFVGAYTTRGLRTAIHEYGLDAKLAAQGLADFTLVVSDEDPFRHRLEVRVPEGHVMDMRLHLSSASLPRDASSSSQAAVEQASIVVVEWLLMQNPRASFTTARPRLPGQQHPGTGLGRDIAQLLVIMCRRIGRDGLVIVPERFHLAELYARGGWLAPNPAAQRDVDDVLAASKAAHLTFAARAWAVERGFVLDERGGGGVDGDAVPFVYRPEERALPVSERMQLALAPGGFLSLHRLLEPRRTFRVDVDGLAQSLREKPVEGMDADRLVE